MDNDEVFTLKEAAAFMRMGERTVRDWIAAGRLKAAKSGTRGGKFLILKSDCIAAVKQLMVKQAESTIHHRAPTTERESSQGVAQQLGVRQRLDAALQSRSKGRQ